MRITKPKIPLLRVGDPLAKGLVAAWAFSEGVDDVVRDVTKRYPGARAATTSWERAGPYIHFPNGLNAYIILPNLGFSGDTSISFFVRHRMVSWQEQDSLFGFGVTNPGQSCTLRTGHVAVAYKWYFWGNDLDVPQAALPNYSGTWANVLCVYDSVLSTRHVYHNGLLVASDAPGNPNWTNANYSIGGFNGDWADGDMSIVAVWNRALTSGAARALNADPFRIIRPQRVAGLVAALGAPGTTTIQLDWTDTSEHEDGFSIERKTDAGAFGEIDTVGVGVETYDNVNVPVGHTYAYRVKAESAALGDSEYSNEAAETV